MKIYKGNYRDHWISPYTIIEYAFFWTDWSKCGRNKSIIDDKDYVDHPRWVEWAVPVIEPISRGIKWALDKIHPPINIVKIDRYDTWSFDHTLADIILPGLKQLKFTKHGAPHTDDSDVPEYLRSDMAQPKEYEWDVDSLHFMRWDWILDEEIWAFEQLVNEEKAESKFFDHSAYEDNKKGTDEWFKDMSDGVSKVKYDREGHEAWRARMDNGFRLFGKYYRCHWD